MQISSKHSSNGSKVAVHSIGLQHVMCNVTMADLRKQYLCVCIQKCVEGEIEEEIHRSPFLQTDADSALSLPPLPVEQQYLESETG